jgi:hypothetical protein
MRLLSRVWFACACAIACGSGCGKKGDAVAAADAAAVEDARVVIAVGVACAEERASVCSGDSALRCVGGVWAVINTCRGDGGCVPDETRHKVRCDDSVAREGDPCDTPDQPACSDDGTSELLCRDGGFVKTRACKKPCERLDAGVRCN